MIFVKWPKLLVWHIKRDDHFAATLCYLQTSGPGLLRTKRRPARVCKLCDRTAAANVARKRSA